MKTILLGIIWFLGFSAWGQVEVNCYQGDCMTYGWEIRDGFNRLMGEVVCFQKSCETHGWTERDHLGRPVLEVFCVGKGCFKTGWEAESPRDINFFAQLSCFSDPENKETDCLRFGWRVDTSFASSEALCLGENCWENGWNLWTNRGMLRFRCKPGGCFKTGWRQQLP